MAVGDILQTTAVYDVVAADGELANIYHYRQTLYDGFSTDFALGDLLANLFGALIAVNLMPALSTSITLDRIDFHYVNKPTIGGTAPQAVVGLVVTQLLPLRSAPVIKKITGLRGRSFQGRNYLPPLTEDVQDGGVLSAGIVTGLIAYAGSLLTIDDGGMINQWQQTIYSATLSTPPTIFVDTLVEDIVVNPVLGTVRGRQEVT